MHHELTVLRTTAYRDLQRDAKDIKKKAPHLKL